MENEFAVTSPDLPVDEGILRTPTDFVHGLVGDLTDSQSQEALRVIIPIKKKWQARFIYKFSGDPKFNVDEAMRLVDQFEDEIKTELMNRCQLLVSVDVTPLLEGKPTVIVLEGALPGHDISKYGFDHEREIHEVKKATKRGEAFLGQKEKPHTNG